MGQRVRMDPGHACSVSTLGFGMLLHWVHLGSEQLGADTHRYQRVIMTGCICMVDRQDS